MEKSETLQFLIFILWVSTVHGLYVCGVHPFKVV